MSKNTPKIDKWESLDAKSHTDHKTTESKNLGIKTKTKRSAISLSMSPDEKSRYASLSRDHGLSLSAFFRLAADEYIKTHEW